MRTENIEIQFCIDCPWYKTQQRLGYDKWESFCGYDDNPAKEVGAEKIPDDCPLRNTVVHIRLDPNVR